MPLSRHSLRSHPCATAFTLVEMLVVLVIFSSVLGIAIGALVHSKNANRLLATEQLIADFVRQARHTARSSGAPVVLSVRRRLDAGGRAIGGSVAGVSRHCIWSQSFDDATNFTNPASLPTSNFQLSVSDQGRDADPLTGITIGKSGFGVVPGKVQATPADYRPMMLSHALTPQEQLVRAGHTDGFYMACSVRPPLAGGAGAAEIPLALIGNTLQRDRAQAGLSLALRQIVIQTNAGTNATLACWEIRGWVWDGAMSGGVPAPTVVSSIDDPLQAASPFLAGGLDVDGPLGGERWEDLGLLFDGQRLILYRNGVPVAKHAFSGVALVPATTVFIGEADPGSGLITAPCALDDVTLYRLGTDQLGELPRAVAPEADSDLIFHPNGQVEPLTPTDVGVRDAVGPKTVFTINGQPEKIRIEQRSALICSLKMRGQREGSAMNAVVVSFAADGTLHSSFATFEAEVGGTVAYPVLEESP